MGYYTGFDITMEPEQTEEMFNKILNDLIELSDYPKDSWDWRPPTPPMSHICIYASWYDWDTNLIELSKRYPDIRFTVYGDGDSSDDRWKAWFQNGKSYQEHAEIIYPVYDESKMK